MTEVDVIILAGGPKTASIASALGRPIWDLPIAPSVSLLDGWDQVLDRGFGATPGLGIRDSVVLVSGEVADCPRPRHSGMRIRPEVRSHRGTAGVVADELASRCSGDDGLVLVIQASSSPAIRMDALLQSGQRALQGDCLGVLGESALGRFCGAILCRRAIFGKVPSVGFCDLKEQLLPGLKMGSSSLDAACVADRARSMQTRVGWLSIAAEWASLDPELQGPTQLGDPATRMAGPGCVVQRSAETRGATLVSSIVMDGAVVEPGAVVARSIIGPGMRVKAGSRVIDAIVAETSRSSRALKASLVRGNREYSP